MVLITGMNLTKPNETPEKKNTHVNRNERRIKQEKSNYEMKRSQPYNRTFAPTRRDIAEVELDVARSERRKYRKQARLQTGFMQWTLGLFSGLVAILVMGAFLNGKDIENNWQANSGAAPMITENAQQSTEAIIIEPIPDVAADTPNNAAENDLDVDNAAREDSDSVEDIEQVDGEKVIYLDGKPLSEADLSGKQ